MARASLGFPLLSGGRRAGRCVRCPGGSRAWAVPGKACAVWSLVGSSGKAGRAQSCGNWERWRGLDKPVSVLCMPSGVSLWDLRMPGLGGALGGGFVLLQRTFQKASHCSMANTGGQLILPLSSGLPPAPCAGLWSAHSESQTHAWAPATDRVGRVCWPGRALGPHRMPRVAQLWRQLQPAPATSVLVRAGAPGPVGPGKCPRACRWGPRPQGSRAVLGWLAWGPGIGLALGDQAGPCPGPVLASLFQMWGLGVTTPPGLPVQLLVVTARSGEPSESW